MAQPNLNRDLVNLGVMLIIFFCQLTNIVVIALLKAIAEAMSDNKELSRVFHHTIASDLKVIASALLDISNPHEYPHICY